MTVIPTAFIWKRAHSIAGLWLSAFLIQHLLVNSQAALFVGDDGEGFIRAANALESLPFLPILELLVLGVPILVHLVWGVQYLRTAKYNSASNDGTTPRMTAYPRNHAYTWQRITAWLLILGVLAHVVHMRFMERPEEIRINGDKIYRVQLKADEGLPTLASRLHVELSPDKEGEVIATAPDFGRAELLMVRETFKSPIMILLYTLFVLAACFHAFNGVWTFLIKWGVALNPRSQQLFRMLTTGLMIIVSFLGLAAVWGTYWVNLRQ